MPGLEYVLVLALTFGAGVSVGKDIDCNHTKKVIVVKHRPWYTLHVDGFHFHTKKCKHKKHKKRKWKKRIRDTFHHRHHRILGARN